MPTFCIKTKFTSSPAVAFPWLGLIAAWRKVCAVWHWQNLKVPSLLSVTAVLQPHSAAMNTRAQGLEKWVRRLIRRVLLLSDPQCILTPQMLMLKMMASWSLGAMTTQQVCRVTLDPWNSNPSLHSAWDSWEAFKGIANRAKSQDFNMPMRMWFGKFCCSLSSSSSSDECAAMPVTKCGRLCGRFLHLLEVDLS